jgi:hypothetical protein
MRHRRGPVAPRLTISICALALVLVTGAGGLSAQASGRTGRRVAKAAKVVSLVETAQLKLVREEGAALFEHGHASGTYNAPVTATLTIHPTYVTAVVTISPRGGSLTGTARANYIVKGSTGYYGGNLTITRGTGSFRRISGKALGFSGTVNRYTFAMTVKAHGQVNL